MIALNSTFFVVWITFHIWNQAGFFVVGNCGRLAGIIHSTLNFIDLRFAQTKVKMKDPGCILKPSKLYLTEKVS